MIFATLGISIPNFVLSSALQFLLCVHWHFFPVARWGSWEHTILPTIALAALPTAFIARLTRSNLIEVLEQDYIQTALAKGLPLWRVAIFHGLRNALLPVVTYLGPVATQILTGSFMIERIFAVPGLGQWMILSIAGRDYPMIIGLTIFFSSCLLLAMFCVDLIHPLLDPRIYITPSYRYTERDSKIGF
jgi:oligopeptide transport system permease protein